jgi:uncharacterized damage-inducible protein DinB
MANERQRPGSNEYAPFYEGYISRVPEGDIIEITRAQIGETVALLDGVDEERAAFAYAPGKWTIKQLVSHMADTERVFTYRALRFARGDETPVPGFDENVYARASSADARPFKSIVNELRAVRAATLALWEGLPAEAWARAGTANDRSVTVRALSYIIAGHELHHRAILQERYLNAK